MQCVAPVVAVCKCKFENGPFELGARLSALRNMPSGCTLAQNGVIIGIRYINDKALLGCSVPCQNKVRAVDGFAACGLLLEKITDD